MSTYQNANVQNALDLLSNSSKLFERKGPRQVEKEQQSALKDPEQLRKRKQLRKSSKPFKRNESI